MARFDVYANRRGGYLLDVQTDLLLHNLGTRVVVPLMPADRVPSPLRRLHPVFFVEDDRYIMATHLMSAVSIAELGSPVASLDAHYDEIVAAIDMIFLGF